MTDRTAFAGDSSAAIEAVWRLESTRLMAALVRIVRDVGLAEDLAQDALVAALEQWPESGVPANPAAWLMTTAKRRAIDMFRRNRRLEQKQQEIAHDVEIEQGLGMPELEAMGEEDIGDDLLRLIF